MTEFTRSYDIAIEAPVPQVFDYCRDPRHLFEGWPQLEVKDVHINPDGVGTTANIVGTFGRGLLVEQIEREFTEFVPDEMIVSKAHAKVRFLGRTKEVANGPIFTWLFEPTEAGTNLTMIIQETDLNWIQDITEYATAAVLNRNMNSMLAAIKEGVEDGASPSD